MNMFIRSHAGFKIEADKAKTVLREARVVASDETGVRIEGTNSYHWLFHCKDAVVHQPDYSRAARVVEETMGGHEPEVWISDRYSAQQKHGAAHQTCLAHLARDTAFALEHGSDDAPAKAVAWQGVRYGCDIANFAASTIASKKRALEQQLESLLGAATECDLARQLQAKIGRAQDQLLTFCDYPGEVDATNNGSERKQRPCVIQRKVTNGYRAMWTAAPGKHFFGVANDLVGCGHMSGLIDAEHMSAGLDEVRRPGSLSSGRALYQRVGDHHSTIIRKLPISSLWPTWPAIAQPSRANRLRMTPERPTHQPT